MSIQTTKIVTFVMTQYFEKKIPKSCVFFSGDKHPLPILFNLILHIQLRPNGSKGFSNFQQNQLIFLTIFCPKRVILAWTHYNE